MKRIVVWQRTDTMGLERAEVDMDPLRLEGDVVVIEDGEPCVVSYHVEYGDAERTSWASVVLKRSGQRQECNLERSTLGRWTVNGTLLPELDGLEDVDLSVTPSTNTPMIRRLRLGIGQRAELTAVWVRFPALEVAPLRQTYRRVGAHSYEYEAPALDFAARLECDEECIVRHYRGLWKAWPRLDVPMRPGAER